MNQSQKSVLPIQSHQLPSPTFEYLENLYIKTLYDLQKKDTFVPYMLEKLSRNFSLNKKEDNVALLMKVGKYFEDAGIS